MNVNTLIIGAGRSGTTSLCKIIEEHPQVCFSKIKEVHYFSIKDLNQRGDSYYNSFFPHYKKEKVIASADTYLLMDYDAIKRIVSYNPKMKIIVLLRNPVDRAYSSYNYSVNYGYHELYSNFLESQNKEQSIKKVSSIIQRNNLGHFYGSLYFKHLNEWCKIFNKNQILVLTTNELKNDLKNLKEKLSQFLDIDSYEELTGREKKQNTNAVPKFKGFEQFLLNRDNPLRKVIRWATPAFLKKLIINSNVVDKIHDLNRKPSEYLPLDSETYKKAMLFFKDDLQSLEREFGVKL